MKKIFNVPMIVLSVILFFSIPSWAYDFNISGQISNIEDNMITMSDISYSFDDEKCHVYIRYMENGSIQEKVSSLDYVRIGAWVTLYVAEGNIIEQIFIDDYRKE